MSVGRPLVESQCVSYAALLSVSGPRPVTVKPYSKAVRIRTVYRIRLDPFRFLEGLARVIAGDAGAGSCEKRPRSLMQFLERISFFFPPWLQKNQNEGYNGSRTIHTKACLYETSLFTEGTNCT